ncbi:MAG: PD-(D/E)XK nuclease family protein [Brevinematales bacterium]|nr:PD-(D/E)XK nuclease family protein [Brevinematales bacterium]
MFKDRSTRISKTEFINLLKCPYTWFLSKITGIKTTPTRSMKHGINLHDIMKKVNEEKDLYRIRHLLNKYQNENPHYQTEISNIQKFLDYRKVRKQTIFPKFTEQRFETTFNKLKLVGVVDAIYEENNYIEIFEYKKSLYNIKSIFLEVSYYSFIISKNDTLMNGKNEIRMGTFSFDTGTIKYRRFKTENISRKLKKAIRIIEKRKFVPKPSIDNCRTCIFRTHCIYKKY